MSILRRGPMAAWLAVGVALLVPASAAAVTVTDDAGGNVTVVSAPGEQNGFTFQHEKEVHTTATTAPFTTTFPTAWVVSSSVLPPGSGLSPGSPLAVPASPPCTQSNPAPTSPVVCPDGGSIAFELGDGTDNFGGNGGGHLDKMLPSHVIVDGGSGKDFLAATATGGTWEIDGGPDDDELQLVAVNVLSEGVNVRAALPGTYIFRGGEGDDRLLTSNFLFGGSPLVGSDAIPVQVDGGPGNDQIHLIETEGDDHLDGGEGDDTFEDGLGDDTVEGGPGNDNLFGGQGKDILSGGPGNDQLVSTEVGLESPVKPAGPEPDTVECGTGTDRVYADETDAVAADCDELGDVIQSCTEAGGCQVAVTIEAPPAAEAGASASAAVRRHHKKRPAILGRGSFHLGKNKSKLAAARLLKSGQKLIKKKKRLKATIVVRVTSGHGKHKKVKSHRGKVLLVSGHKK